MSLTVTIRQLIVAKEEIMNYSISQQILHYGDTREFEKKYGLYIEAAKDKLNKLWKRYYQYENGVVKTEDIFKRKWFFWKVKVGVRLVPLTDFSIPMKTMTEEEFLKLENEILDKEINK